MPHGSDDLDPAIARYIASSYPHNHDYRVVRGTLRPRWKLARRWRKIRRLYPESLASLADLSCSKGFFVLDAAARPSCARALGIDVHEPDLAVCRALKEHLGLERARFERLRLHELAPRIGEFGGPFQTVLLINSYHYLYFGSERAPELCASHAELFRHLRAVTAERLIFSNRLELARCPRNLRRRAAELGIGGDYRADDILAAARAHFAVERRGRLGRIPLLLMRPASRSV